ncbi:MAG: cysteine desulfurase family protein [Limisphaerales bacterium]
MIYLDNNATTRVDPLVFGAMRPYLEELWGNPSSGYRFGREVAAGVKRARGQVAGLLGAREDEVIFTACGTESIHTAIWSALQAGAGRRHLVTTAVEHSAVVKVCAGYASRGYELSVVPVDGEGLVDLGEVERVLRPDTALVSMIWGNNETGVLGPVQGVAELCRDRGIPLHVDAVQVAGKRKIDVGELQADFLSLSGHKFRAPKGVGCLYVRRGTAFHPWVVGGGQESGRRGGTENVAGVVGLGAAAELAVERLGEYGDRVRGYRDALEGELCNTLPGVRVNGSVEHRLSNTSNLSFEGVDGEALMLLLDGMGVCVSTGSACSTGSIRPSRVLTAMGRSAGEARGTIRFSWGWDNSGSEVGEVASAVRGAVERLRGELRL